ncbi:hypothetical protein L204_105976 [Cryptococcus depauperatus]
MWGSTCLLAVVFLVHCGKATQLQLDKDGLAQQLYSDAKTIDSMKEDGSHEISMQAETIVSALSASHQHTTFLHLLQRSKCIPMLAHIGNATVFAPTDEAWKNWADRNKPVSSMQEDEKGGLINGWLGPGGIEEWLMSEEDLFKLRITLSGDEEQERRTMDNQNWALRQHLLYHLLNYTLPPSSFLSSGSGNITIHTTLLFPLAKQPQLPPTPEHGPPWLPRGGEGLLGGHGQRLRIARQNSMEGGVRGKVGVGSGGQCGVGIWDGRGWLEPKKNGTSAEENQIIGARWTSNGVVVGLDGVIDMPPSIEEIIHTHPQLSYLSRILSLSSPPSPLPSSFAITPHLTVFAPSNEAFKAAFDEMERGYLEGPYGEEGVGRTMAHSIVSGGKGKGVWWSDAFCNKSSDLETISGQHLNVTSYHGIMTVNGTITETVDIFASNGVLHIVPMLPLPSEFSLLNSAEKMLLTLNATNFVSLMRSANLSDTYIGKASHEKGGKEYTILAPTDDVLEKWGGLDPFVKNRLLTRKAVLPYQTRSFEDASPLAALLQYHILPGKLLPYKIKDGHLLLTEMRTSSLDGERQRLRVEINGNNEERRNDWEIVGEGRVRFGGSIVLGKPVKSGNNIIYLISGLLSTPDSVLQTAVSDLQLSMFVAALYAAELAKSTKHLTAVTYFMPHNSAFDQLGLAMNWLLLADGKVDLRKVIKYHCVEDLIYSQNIETGKKIYKTIEGGDLVLNRLEGEHGAITIGSPTKWQDHDSGTFLPSNGELHSSNVSALDALTETGVIHTVNHVVLPADVNITIGKLIKGSKQTTMANLMIKAGLRWILEGREPTKEEVQESELQGIVNIRSKLDLDEDKSEDDNEAGDDLAYPSYVVLCPTDKAFSKLNLTYYTNTPSALLDLLKLHIIPSAHPSATGSLPVRLPSVAPKEGEPLSLADDTVYSTLLSGKSKYADLAFRNMGDSSWLVGIKNARKDGLSISARIGASGRATVRWKNSKAKVVSNKSSDNGKYTRDGKSGKDGKDGKDEDDEANKLWRGGMVLGGGLLVIDSALIPYEPSWFYKWGVLTITLSGMSLLLLVVAAGVGYWFWTNKEREEYEPILVEEDVTSDVEAHT